VVASDEEPMVCCISVGMVFLRVEECYSCFYLPLVDTFCLGQLRCEE
jgi:hypothetical protein